MTLWFGSPAGVRVAVPGRSQDLGIRTRLSYDRETASVQDLGEYEVLAIGRVVHIEPADARCFDQDRRKMAAVRMDRSEVDR